MHTAYLTVQFFALHHASHCTSTHYQFSCTIEAENCSQPGSNVVFVGCPVKNSHCNDVLA